MYDAVMSGDVSIYDIDSYGDDFSKYQGHGGYADSCHHVSSGWVGGNDVRVVANVATQHHLA